MEIGNQDNEGMQIGPPSGGVHRCQTHNYGLRNMSQDEVVRHGTCIHGCAIEQDHIGLWVNTPQGRDIILMVPVDSWVSTVVEFASHADAMNLPVSDLSDTDEDLVTMHALQYRDGQLTGLVRITTPHGIVQSNITGTDFRIADLWADVQAAAERFINAPEENKVQVIRRTNGGSQNIQS